MGEGCGALASSRPRNRTRGEWRIMETQESNRFRWGGGTRMVDGVVHSDALFFHVEQRKIMSWLCLSSDD